MASKEKFSFRLSFQAYDYLCYCAKVSDMSVSRFLDFMLISLSLQDGFYKFDENKASDIDY